MATKPKKKAPTPHVVEDCTVPPVTEPSPLETAEIPEVKTFPTPQEQAAAYIARFYPRSRIDVAGKLDAILMELVIARCTHEH